MDFGGLAVFAEAKDTYVCIPLLAKSAQPPRIEITRVQTLDPTLVETQMRQTDCTVPHDRFSREAWSLASDAEVAVFARLSALGKPLGSIVKGGMYRGILSGLKEAFSITTEQREAIVARAKASAELIHPCRGGEDVRDYFIRPRDEWIIVLPCGFTRAALEASGTLSERKAWEWLSDKHPGIATHLVPFERALRARQDQGEFWWEFRPCDYYHVLDGPKIVFPDICKRPRFCYDDTGIYVTNTAYFLGTGDKYLLALLNSRVFWFCIRHISIPFGIRAGEYRYRMFYQYVETVPIRICDHSKPDEKALHDQIIACADRMLAAKQSEAAATGHLKDNWTRQIATLDRQINALVYELYGLTEEEIALVEKTGAAE